MAKLKAAEYLCKAKTRAGTPCQVAALPGADYCFFHDPAKADERREAQGLGGRQNRMKTLDAAAPDVKIEDCQDVVALMSGTINQVLKGQIDPRVANTVGYLANVTIRAVEQGNLERRIAELEALFRSRSQAPDLLPDLLSKES